MEMLQNLTKKTVWLLQNRLIISLRIRNFFKIIYN